jgi:putative ABC transport system permease protein
MQTLMQDLRSGLRMLRKNPGFCAVIVLLLALGIGANTAVFSVVNSVLLRPLPFERPEQLVRVTADFQKLDMQDVGLSASELFDYRDRSGLFESISGVYPIDANLTGGDGPERVQILLVDAEYFSILGTAPQIGRTFEKSDYDPGIGEVAVISDGLWRRRFGSDPDVIGKAYMTDNDPIRIVGVMPPDFRHPGRTPGHVADMWCPAGWVGIPFQAPVRRQYMLQGAIGRLAPGVSLETAQARLDAFGSDLRQEFPADYVERAGWGPRIIGLHEDLVGETGPVLVLLLGAVGVVLLIACANIANLLLARASARHQEMSIRGALGASRMRIVRQLLTESTILALIGGVLGVLLARWIADILTSLSPVAIGHFGTSAQDLPVLFFCLAVSVATGVLCGLAPAIQSSRADNEALKGVTRGATDGAGRAHVRSLLVVSQFALALVLMIAGALLVRSFWRLQNVDPGFDAENVLTAKVWLPQPDVRETGPYFKQERRSAFYRQVLDRLAALPGVKSVGGVNPLPLTDRPFTSSFRIDGRAVEEGEAFTAQAIFATPDYFRTMNIGVVQGRLFTLDDGPDKPGVVVVNRTLARQYFSNDEPIGKRVRFGGNDATGPWLTVVGIVDDVKAEGLDLESKPQIYRSVFYQPGVALTFIARTEVEPGTLAGAVQREVSAVDSDMPVFEVRPMSEIVAEGISRQRFAMAVLSAFAVVALLLSAVGIGGVTAYVTGRRTREIGIRMALGAQPGDVLRMIVGQGLRLVVTGLVVGLIASFLLTRFLASLLFGVSATDPVTFSAIASLLVAVALFACYLPARRATRVDPIEALRDE